jgi:transposase
MNEIGFSFKRPRMSSKLSDKEEQKRFQNTFYYITKSIESVAIEKGRELKYLCIDEASFRRDGTIHNGWYLKGLTPEILESNGRFESIKLFGAVDPLEGDVTLRNISGRMTAKMHSKYLIYLSKKYSNKELVILEDNAPWHSIKKVSQYLKEANVDNIHIIKLPKYSPEMNPCEKLWKWLREDVTHCKFHSDLKSLSDDIWKFYRRVSNKKEVAISRFITEIYLFNNVA